MRSPCRRSCGGSGWGGACRCSTATSASAAWCCARGLRGELRSLGDGELRTARRRILLAEKARILDAEHAGVVGTAAREEILVDIDERLVALEEEDEEDVGPTPAVGAGSAAPGAADELGSAAGDDAAATSDGSETPSGPAEGAGTAAADGGGP